MQTLGCDITEHAAPNLAALPGLFRRRSGLRSLWRNVRRGVWNPGLRIYSYEEATEAMWQARPGHPFVPGFFVGWDNTPRRGAEAIVITHVTPEAVRRALARVVASVAGLPPERRIVMLNAWNEWAEGMHLEPDQKYGHAYLEAVASVVGSNASATKTGSSSPL
jgi:hypothetical protein